MTLTPRGASDVPETIDATHVTFDEPLSADECEQVSRWVVDNPGMSRASGMMRLWSAYRALTTRSAALEADKAELVKQLDDLTCAQMRPTATSLSGAWVRDGRITLGSTETEHPVGNILCRKCACVRQFGTTDEAFIRRYHLSDHADDVLQAQAEGVWPASPPSPAERTECTCGLDTILAALFPSTATATPAKH